MTHRSLKRWSGSHSTRRGFTLVELLTAMGVMLVLAAITLVAVTSISRSTRVSSAINTVSAALSNARALAIKNARPVLVVFLVSWDPNEPDTPQRTQIVIGEWTGETVGTNWPDDATLDRFVPVQDIPFETLPKGVKVAGPWYEVAGGLGGDNAHNIWVTQPDIRRTSTGQEGAGRVIGIMYGPDGTLITRNPISDADELFMDMNRGFAGGIVIDSPYQDFGPVIGSFAVYSYNEVEDESRVNMVPFIAVYDDDLAREDLGVAGWDDEFELRSDLSAYIAQFGEQIHFNRYTGVFMK